MADQTAAEAPNAPDSPQSQSQSQSQPSKPEQKREAGAASTPTSTQGSAVHGASLLIILQIVSRAITFIANQLLLRYLTAQLLGVSTQLEVYYLSVLFFARESLRVAIQRQATSSSSTSGTASKSNAKRRDDDLGRRDTAADSQSVVNIAHLSLPLGLAAAFGLGWAYLHYVDSVTASTPYLSQALRVYAFAAVIELLSEPAFVVLQHRLRFGPRAAAESIATFMRCMITFVAANAGSRHGIDIGVLPFALGQLAYSLGLCSVYLWNGTELAQAEGFSLLPESVITAASQSKEFALGLFYTPTLQLASSLMAQSLVKHILTQGDTFLVSILSSPQSQGVYALANNYGSLLARLVFQPIEESSRNYFSKLLSTSSPSTAPAKPSLYKAKADLQSLLKFYVLMAMVVLAIGPYAAPLLVQLSAGSRWSASGAGGVLAVYCGYIPLLAINGVAEAFVSSVATEAEVHRQSAWMGFFSLAFGAGGFVFMKVLDLGAAGLVYANSINMLCRIIWSAAFITRYFTSKSVDFSLRSVAPATPAATALALALPWPAFTKLGLSIGGISPQPIVDLAKVAAVAVPYVALLGVLERRYLATCYTSLLGHRSGKPSSS